MAEVILKILGDCVKVSAHNLASTSRGTVNSLNDKVRKRKLNPFVSHREIVNGALIGNSSHASCMKLKHFNGCVPP